MKQILIPLVFRFYLWLLGISVEGYFEMLGRDWQIRQELKRDAEWLGEAE